MTLGEAVAKARAKKGLTLRELSRLTGIQNSHISELETGRRPNPAWLNVVKIAVALDLRVDRIIRAAGIEENRND